jgi:hypothetical protein
MRRPERRSARDGAHGGHHAANLAAEQAAAHHRHHDCLGEEPEAARRGSSKIRMSTSTRHGSPVDRRRVRAGYARVVDRQEIVERISRES